MAVASRVGVGVHPANCRDDGEDESDDQGRIEEVAAGTARYVSGGEEEGSSGSMASMGSSSRAKDCDSFPRIGGPYDIRTERVIAARALTVACEEVHAWMRAHNKDPCWIRSSRGLASLASAPA